MAEDSSPIGVLWLEIFDIDLEIRNCDSCDKITAQRQKGIKRLKEMHGDYGWNDNVPAIGKFCKLPAWPYGGFEWHNCKKNIEGTEERKKQSPCKDECWDYETLLKDLPECEPCKERTIRRQDTMNALSLALRERRNSEPTPGVKYSDENRDFAYFLWEDAYVQAYQPSW